MHDANNRPNNNSFAWPPQTLSKLQFADFPRRLVFDCRVRPSVHSSHLRLLFVKQNMHADFVCQPASRRDLFARPKRKIQATNTIAMRYLVMCSLIVSTTIRDLSFCTIFGLDLIRPKLNRVLHLQIRCLHSCLSRLRGLANGTNGSPHCWWRHRFHFDFIHSFCWRKIWFRRTMGRNIDSFIQCIEIARECRRRPESVCVIITNHNSSEIWCNFLGRGRWSGWRFALEKCNVFFFLLSHRFNGVLVARIRARTCRH